MGAVSKQAAGLPVYLDDTPFCAHFCILSSPLPCSALYLSPPPLYGEDIPHVSDAIVSCMFTEKWRASESHQYKKGHCTRKRKLGEEHKDRYEPAKEYVPCLQSEH